MKPGNLILGMTLLWGCNGDELSVGELRCVATHCDPPTGATPLDDDVERAELGSSAPQPAHVAWRTPLECPTGAWCTFVLPQSRNAAHWVVHRDGSVTTARLYGDDPIDGGFWLFHYAPDGTLRWERSQQAAGDGAAVALISDDEDGVIVASTSITARGALSVYRVQTAADGASASLELLFEAEQGTQPEALAWAGDDLLIAGYHDGNPELVRHRLDGTLVWRQAVLRPNGADALGVRQFDTGLQLASAEDGRAILAVPAAGQYGFAQVEADGSLRWFSTFGYSPTATTVRARVALDAEGRPLLGADGSEEAYSVVRCGDLSCSGTRALVERERDEYYEPDLFGMASDDESRLYVLTQAGARDARQVLIDRIGSDLSSRESFVVDGDEAPVALGDLRIGPDASVYYWAVGELGRIDLP